MDRAEDGDFIGTIRAPSIPEGGKSQHTDRRCLRAEANHTSKQVCFLKSEQGQLVNLWRFPFWDDGRKDVEGYPDTSGGREPRCQGLVG